MCKAAAFPRFSTVKHLRFAAESGCRQITARPAEARIAQVQALWWLLVAERVLSWDIGFRWEPSAPDAVLAVADSGRAVLALRPHFDDPDQDCVVVVWSGTRAAVMGPPNDEARSGHRLYRRGLAELLWAGQVEHSEWIADLERQNRGHNPHDSARYARLTHFILPLKDSVVEVAAEDAAVLRRSGSTVGAAAESFRQ